MKRFYECGICGHNHPWDWRGDCREDSNRFTNAALDETYGQTGYELSSWEERQNADMIGKFDKFELMGINAANSALMIPTKSNIEDIIWAYWASLQDEIVSEIGWTLQDGVRANAQFKRVIKESGVDTSNLSFME